MLSRITLFVLLACCAGPAVALTLGEIEGQSALYQRLSARIALQQGRGEDVRDLQVSLASAADFKRMGVERNFMLTQLQFEVIRERGQSIIEITTRRPVVEPYLDFVVDVVWRQGRMLKEYTVLLDPPGLAQQAPVQSSRSEPATSMTAQTAPRPRTEQAGNA
ncbi:MAG: FimV family protein, partial [Pseudomonadales bacterium]